MILNTDILPGKTIKLGCINIPTQATHLFVKKHSQLKRKSKQNGLTLY